MKIIRYTYSLGDPSDEKNWWAFVQKFFDTEEDAQKDLESWTMLTYGGGHIKSIKIFKVVMEITQA